MYITPNHTERTVSIGKTKLVKQNEINEIELMKWL